MRARLSIVAILLGLISTTAVAHAQDGPPPGRSQGNAQVSSAGPDVPPGDYYGWQVMLVDVANVALMITTGGESGALSLGGYLLGGPIVHAAHGNPGSALTSVGLRAGLPVAGFFVGVLMHDGGGWDELGAGAAGGVAGLLIAVSIDWVALSRDERPAPAATNDSLVVVPQVGVSEQGVSLGVVGRF
jgi:hypothetical protein